MRLLNTTSYHLSEFFEGSIPIYAILSHRWEAEEVIFQDFDPVKGFTTAREKKGWAKIVGCCKQGFQDDYEWVWIDTCCIDKSSSAELSEAINSMFNWYKVADICYAYLSDVGGMEHEDQERGEVKFVDSVWFQRGWTLQELLAPEVLIFFNHSWKRLGEKMELEEYVKSATAIQKLKYYESAPIAQKMSWAARRRTTRIEDRAYSLMGIFGIHMSPIYGEGNRAFLRLQLEIIKISDDESIFAWHRDTSLLGILAESPDAFARSGNVRRCNFQGSIRSFEMTNKGLRFESMLFEVPSEIEVPITGFPTLLRLNCIEVRPGEEDLTPLILLCKGEGDTYTCMRSVSLPKHQLKPFKGWDGADIGLGTFHVKQFPKTFLVIREPYWFRTRTARGVRDRFKLPGLDDVYVSDSTKGWWTVSNYGEMTLNVDPLSATGINACLIMREIGCQGDTFESESLMKLFIIVHIYKNNLEYRSIYLPANDNADDSAIVLELLTRKPAGQWQQEERDLHRMVAPSVTIERNSIISDYFDIVIEMGSVALVESRHLKLRQGNSKVW